MSDHPIPCFSTLTRRSRTRRWIVALATTGFIVVGGMAVQKLQKRWARAEAARHEVKVKEFVKNEPIANLTVQVPRDGLTGLLAVMGMRGPFDRRGERAFLRINPLPSRNGSTRTAGQAIDASRQDPDVVTATLLLLRKPPVPDPVTLLGPYSSRSRERIGILKGFDFYTYGNLDVFIKDGAFVAVRVR